jgi:toxin ParE1/3/4
VTRGQWKIRISAAADYDEILRWTSAEFGSVQATSYGGLLAAAVARLEGGPSTAGVKQRDEIGAGICTIHVGRRARHFILFRVGSETERAIDVPRILHDAMDLARHV